MSSIDTMDPTATLQVRSHRRAQWFWIDNDVIDAHAQAIGPIGVALYCALARHCNHKTSQCYPSFGRLGRQLGLTPLTVSRYVQRLVDRRLITVEARPGHPALITLLDMPLGEDSLTPSRCEEGYISGKEVKDGGTNPVHGGTYQVKTPSLPGKDEPDSPNQKERTNTPSDNRAAIGKGKPTDGTPSWDTSPAVVPSTPLERPDDQVAQLPVDPATFARLYVMAVEHLVARGTKRDHIIVPTIQAEMLALYEEEQIILAG
jgi:Helix-turn-helix domain